MSKIKFVEKTLEELFENKRGNSKYTKKFCNSHAGDYEVFTGTTIGSFAFVNFYDYEIDLLTYTTDGENAGTLKILTGKYNVGGHRAILLPKYKNMNLEFFEKTLQKRFYDLVKKGDVPSISWRNIKNEIVSIPVNEHLEFDIKKQNEIVKKYRLIEDKKRELKQKLDYINSVEVDFVFNDIGVKLKKILFQDLFEIQRGKVLSLKYINDNKGKYPVYSTQLDKAFGYIDSYMYDGNYLIWNTDGLGGYIRNVNGKFSITNIVGIMKLKKEYIGKINLEYIRRVLQPIFRNSTKGREGTFGKNEYTKINSTMIKNLNIEIEIPVTKDGKIDLEKQNEIVEKYELIEKMKHNITKKGLPFTLANVALNGLTPYIYIYIYIELSHLFDIIRGKSRYTKLYCKENFGDYPIYSADNKSPLSHMKTYDYDGKYLTVSVNGIAGVTRIYNGRFSINADRVILIPKLKNINIDYVSNILESSLRDVAKGRKGLNRKNEFTKLTKSMIENIKIPMPFDMYADLDSDIQSDIENKYKTIFDIKEILSKKVEALMNLDIKF